MNDQKLLVAVAISIAAISILAWVIVFSHIASTLVPPLMI